MKETINVKWLKNLAFEANIDEHKIVMDAKAEEEALTRDQDQNL